MITMCNRWLGSYPFPQAPGEQLFDTVPLMPLNIVTFHKCRHPESPF